MDDIEYIASRCDLNEETGCWEWTGTTDACGYGLFRRNGKVYRAHRFSYFASRYEWPEICRHMCHNRLCCNPLHLENGTPLDNARDRDAAGRANRPTGTEHHEAKMGSGEVPQILDLLAYGFFQYEIASMYGISQNLVSRIKQGKHWSQKITN